MCGKSLELGVSVTRQSTAAPLVNVKSMTPVHQQVTDVID